MSEESSKSYSTRTADDVYLRNWIVPVWGSRSLSDVRTVAVEDWLRTLPLANGSNKPLRMLGFSHLALYTRRKMRNGNLETPSHLFFCHLDRSYLKSPTLDF
jgi:hypothetical protein